MILNTLLNFVGLYTRKQVPSLAASSLTDVFRVDYPGLPAHPLVDLCRSLEQHSQPEEALRVLSGVLNSPESLTTAVDELQKETAFREAQARSRIRELYLAEIFQNIEEVEVPVGAVNEETGHSNAVD